MNRRLATTVLLIVTALVATAPGVGARPDVRSERLAGEDRYLTARAIAERTYSTANAPVLATGEDFPDALAASYLTGSVGTPILLTTTGGLRAGVTDTLEALGANGVQIVGGTAAVSDQVVSDLTAAGYQTDRLAGTDRYETAAAIASLFPQEGVGQFGVGRAAIVVNGANFPDALTAGPVAHSQGYPLLLTQTASLSAPTRGVLDELNIEQVIIVGGTAAVSAATEAQIVAMGIAVRRVAGANRQGTALAVANFAVDELDYQTETVLLARPDRFPDALAGGPRGGEIQSPILLTASPTALGGEARSFLQDKQATVQIVEIFGGTAAISDATVAEALQAAGGS